MNVRDLAKEVAKREGGKQRLSIAQIMEVIRIVLCLLDLYSADEIREASRRALNATRKKGLR